MARPARSRLPRTPADIAELLGTVPLLASLTFEQRELIAHSTVARKARRGDIVYAQGAPGEALFVVARGSVLVHRIGRGGERRAMAVVEAPGSFGEIALVDGGRRSASVEALEDCDLLVVPRKEFLRLLGEEPRMVQGVMRELGHMVRRLTEQVTDATLLDLPGRVAKTLVRLVEVRRTSDPEAMPVVTLSQSKLAELAGGSRQSVNGALATLTTRGLVRLDGRRIVVVDLPGLRHRAGLSNGSGPAPAPAPHPPR